MKIIIKPFKQRRLRKKMSHEFLSALEKAPVAPIEKLNLEAREFEKLMLNRRSSATK